MGYLFDEDKRFTVVIERDEDEFYMVSVPELLGCHTQAKGLNELNRRIEEALEDIKSGGLYTSDEVRGEIESR